MKKQIGIPLSLRAVYANLLYMISQSLAPHAFFFSQNVRRNEKNKAGSRRKQSQKQKAPCGIGVLRARVYIQPGYCTIILGNWKMRPFKNAVGRWGLGILSL
jgi:hypothetical protein